MTAMALPWSVEELLPHSGAMILIDDVIASGEGWVESGVRIGEDCLLYEPGLGVPAWMGIEYMAQTVAMYSGIQMKRAGAGIKIGFLLGTRHYVAMTDYYPLGNYLRIHAHEEWQDGQMAVFNCHIESETCLAKARINVYQPDDVLSVIQGSNA
jgi:predicted hotdog family 3-hydroxylacyl-ACP dehydratase